MSHTSFLDIAARIGQIIRYTEKHLVQQNRCEREFATFSHTLHLFESLHALRLDLQAVIQRRSNEQYERFSRFANRCGCFERLAIRPTFIFEATTQHIHECDWFIDS